MSCFEWVLSGWVRVDASRCRCRRRLAVSLKSWFFSREPALVTKPTKFDIAGDDDFDVDTDYILGGLGLSVQKGRFFVDLYGQTNLSDAEDDVDNFADLDGITRESQVDRYELNATLGYAITDQVSVFSGLKYATNEVNSNIQ